VHGIVNDAMAMHFADATIAASFVARWCKPPAPIMVLGATSFALGLRSGVAGRPDG
jgi:hypothetical protein